MCAFTDDVSRTIKLMGTDGEIRGVISRERNELEVLHFPSRSRLVRQERLVSPSWPRSPYQPAVTHEGLARC
jgi:hypothetical protein